jgi:hypothetical protein
MKAIPAGTASANKPRLKTSPQSCSASEALELEVLKNLPNDLARLCYLRSFFDANSGQYRDHGRSPRFGAEASHLASLRAHEDVFARVLRAPLEDLRRQFAEWMEDDPETSLNVLREWSANKTYLLLAPQTVVKAEVRVFEGQMTAVLALLQSHSPANVRNQRKQAAAASE